jgi:dihydrofolate reductase
MGKTQYYTATSIDGFIADAEGSLDWLFEAASSDAKEDRFGRFFADVGAMAMGATTYEWALGHDALLEHPERWAGYYGDTPCWVFSHRRLPKVAGADLRFVEGPVRPVHDAMREAAGDKNVWLVGGGDLVGRFADEGLLGEIRLGVAPVTLGAGAPLLPRRISSSELTLTNVEHDGRFVFLDYEVRRGG